MRLEWIQKTTTNRAKKEMEEERKTKERSRESERNMKIQRQTTWLDFAHCEPAGAQFNFNSLPLSDRRVYCNLVHTSVAIVVFLCFPTLRIPSRVRPSDSVTHRHRYSMVRYIDSRNFRLR